MLTTAELQSGDGMAYDDGLAQVLRDALADDDGITEKKMFGGLCFMWRGHMLCGVHKKGGMARVGKENEPEALKIDGVDPLSFTGRPMGGIVDVSDEAFEDDERRAQIMDLAKQFVETLPPK